MFIEASILIFTLGSVLGARPVVKLQDGRIRGIQMQTLKGRNISAFRNIPYTQRLTFRRRFEELKDADPWEGVLDAGGPPVQCPQITLNNDFTGVENCLFLNVYTPSLPRSSYINKLYPVIVYIHGGAYYFFAGGLYGPRYLLDKDVILVTFNYRIGIPGFGSTADYVLPGNLGLKDQLKALRWVQRNIHYFSGDRNSVTLFGMSSGAASVHLHYFSKQSKGLFHRGFMIGGLATTFWGMKDRPRPRLEQISENIGCPTNSTYDMVACLENLPIKELSMGIRTVQGPAWFPLAPVAPLVDDFSHNPFIYDYPYDALRAGKVANLPMVVGNAENEGIFSGAALLDDEDMMRDIDENWLSRGKFVLELDHVPKAFMNDTLKKIRKYYFGDKEISEATGAEFIKMMSDRYFITNSVKTAIIHARTNPRVYYYLFGFKGPQSTAQAVSKHPEKYGASHIDDLFYIVNVTDKRPLEENATCLLMIERMTTMLASFATTGRPDLGIDVDFQPLGRSSVHDPIRGLHIKSPEEIEMSELDVGNVEFWDSLPILEPHKTSYYKRSSPPE